MYEFRVTLTTNDEEYCYNIMAECDAYAEEEAEAAAVNDGMDEHAYYFTRTEVL